VYIGTGGFDVVSSDCCKCGNSLWNNCGCVETLNGPYSDLSSCETGCGC
jgi:hypothetical protein